MKILAFGFIFSLSIHLMGQAACHGLKPMSPIHVTSVYGYEALETVLQCIYCMILSTNDFVKCSHAEL